MSKRFGHNFAVHIVGLGHMLLLTLIAISLVGCSNKEAGSGTLPVVVAPASPSPEKIDEAKRYVQEGIAIPVNIEPLGAIWDGPSRGGELENLKRNFLQPLASSRYAKKIKGIEIDAGSLEWTQWTCSIELTDYMAPISLTHFGSFYDGTNNQDPDGYANARVYVLGELEKIGKRVGWSNE